MPSKLKYCLLAVIFSGKLLAQGSIEIPLSFPDQKGILKINVYDNPIQVTTYTGNTVIVELLEIGKKNTKNKLSSGQLEFDFKEENNEVTIFKREGKRVTNIQLIIKVPHTFDIQAKTYYGRFIQIENITGNIKVEAYYGDIKLTNIIGNIEAKSFSGMIHLKEIVGTIVVNNTQGYTKAVLNQLLVNGSYIFSSNKGDIEIIIPKDAKANLDFDSYSGKVISDFQFGLNLKEGSKNVDRGLLKRTINGGGSAAITIQSHFGDIIIKQH